MADREANEVGIAQRLGEIADELKAASRQLQISPFVVVQAQLGDLIDELIALYDKGDHEPQSRFEPGTFIYRNRYPQA